MRIDRRTMIGGLTVAMAGCSRIADNSPKPRIALVMKSLANAFFVTMAEGARAYERKNSANFRLMINGTRNEADLAQQVAIIDQMITSGADAIVIAPADSKAIVPAAVRAQKAGLMVVNIDNRLNADVIASYDTHIPFVGPDGKTAAQRVGAVLTETLLPGDQVAILEGITTADNSVQRRDGLIAAALASKLNIVTVQSAAWDQAQAAALSSAILIRYPELKAILCANDSMALGAASAIEQAGRADSVRVTGFDNVEAIQPLLARGLVAATADQHGDLLAVYGIEFALKGLQKRGTQLPDQETPVDLVTHATLASEL